MVEFVCTVSFHLFSSHQMVSHSIPAVSVPLSLIGSESVSHTCPQSREGLHEDGGEMYVGWEES